VKIFTITGIVLKREKDIIKSNQKVNIWICFDEIHKMHKCKNILKGFFDTFENKINFLITGSAKLDMLKKGGDSLTGRYFSYKLNPFIVVEVLNLKLIDILPESDADKTIEKFISKEHENTTIIDQFLKFGPFPEPLLKENEVMLKKWQESYIEKIIIEDIKELSLIHQIRKVEELIYLLPDRIGSPLSINSLKEDLEINFNTVKNYIKNLLLTYVIFDIQPYQKNINRLIKKEKKYIFMILV
jgi:predicted AAA+ superfamily ATPase